MRVRSLQIGATVATARTEIEWHSAKRRYHASTMRMRAAFLLLCALALVVQVAHAARRWRKPLEDTYGRYLGRFAEARAVLASEPRVSYLGDGPRVPNFPDDFSTGSLFAQHALVPIVLMPPEELCRFLLVNWHRPELPPRIPAGYERVRDFGDGVTLWERR